MPLDYQLFQLLKAIILQRFLTQTSSRALFSHNSIREEVQVKISIMKITAYIVIIRMQLIIALVIKDLLLTFLKIRFFIVIIIILGLKQH